MSNQWFRLYTEIMNDPKVLVLTEALRWRYVALLCLHNDHKYENAPDDEISLALRITESEWLDTKSALLNRGLLTKEGKVSGWEKRQYISDKEDPTAAERQQRYRDKKRNERNAAVTLHLPDSDTDSDTEKKEVSVTEKLNALEIESQFQTFLSAFPSKANISDARRNFSETILKIPLEILIAKSMEYASSVVDFEARYIMAPSNWLAKEKWKETFVIPKQNAPRARHNLQA